MPEVKRKKTERYRLYNDDLLTVLPTLEADSFDSVVTDPPYGLIEPRSVKGLGTMQRRGGVRTEEEKAARKGGFMGKAWDADIPNPEHWESILRILKPGGYMLVFGGSRTYHRLACAIEDAGFEIRDCIMWLYGSGFPKGKGCLKPAHEPIILARKPGKKVLPLGIEECRVETAEGLSGGAYAKDGADRDSYEDWRFKRKGGAGEYVQPSGRWPANVAHDGSEEVLAAFAEFGESKSMGGSGPGSGKVGQRTYGDYAGDRLGQNAGGLGDTGTAARFFYCAKSSRSERGEGNTHPTVKPLELMEWLVKLVSREGELVLDPFMGSGTTGKACGRLGRRFVGIEKDTECGYFQTAERKCKNGYGGYR